MNNFLRELWGITLTPHDVTLIAEQSYGKSLSPKWALFDCRRLRHIDIPARLKCDEKRKKLISIHLTQTTKPCPTEVDHATL